MEPNHHPLSNEDLIALIRLANDCLRHYEGINLLHYMDEYPDERERLEKVLSDCGARL